MKQLKHPVPSSVWRRLLIILFWMSVWQLAAVLIRNNIILVGPAEVGLALLRLVPTSQFWLSIAHSFLKISLGFLMAFLGGLALGGASYRFQLLRELLAPVISLLKSIPVASFVILALIWVGSRQLAVLIAFLVVLPMIYVSTLAGLASTDAKLLEMARIFRIPTLKKIRFIYFPALLPYLLSSCRVALGMSWKSGIAAEVIGIPDSSIGEQLYMSKIYLDTADLFAWTCVIIVISALFERMFLALLSRLQRTPGGTGTPDASGAPDAPGTLRASVASGTPIPTTEERGSGL